jgi:hypothetical protein
MNDPDIHIDPKDPPLLRIKSEYRRVGIYLIVAYFLIVGAAAGLNWLGVGGGWDRLAIIVPVLGLVCLALPVLIFRQRLRIDHAGVWRRRLFRWDLWPWDAFTSGQVRHGSMRDSYVYPGKPWWNRYLCLEFLEKRAREAVVRLLKDLWTPPPIQLPETLTLRYGFRKWLFLSPDGLRLGHRSNAPGDQVVWSDVRQIRIRPLDHSRIDFHQLELELPELLKPIRLQVFKGSPSWRGADAEVIVQFLKRYVGCERIQMTAMAGPPLNSEEHDRRLAELNHTERRLRRLRRWGTLCLAFLQAGYVAYILVFGNLPANRLGWHWVQAVAGGAVIFLLACPPFVVWLMLTDRLASLKKQRAELAAWCALQPAAVSGSCVPGCGK